MPTSIKEIAVACNVSIATVSRALRGIEGVSEARRAEIVRVAEELNYIANANARSLVKASSDLVGVCVPTLFNDVFASMLDGLRLGLAKAGISIVVHSNNYEPGEELKWVERLMSWRPAGIVLTGVDHDPLLRQIAKNSGFPIVEIWDVVEDPIDFCVGIDHYKAGKRLGEHAIRLGYRNPGFVCSPKGMDPRSDKRFRGAGDAFRAAGLIDVPIVADTMLRNNFSWGYASTLELCKREGRPDVIFFVNDHLAFGGMSACTELGLSTPDDIGLIGFNDMDVTAVLPRKLTTSRTPRSRMGQIAAQHLIARMNGVEVPRVTEIEPILKAGQTTRQH